MLKVHPAYRKFSAGVHAECIVMYMYIMYITSYNFTIEHVNIGIILLLIGNSRLCLYNTQLSLISCLTLSQEYCKLIG